MVRGRDSVRAGDAAHGIGMRPFHCDVWTLSARAIAVVVQESTPEFTLDALMSCQCAVIRTSCLSTATAPPTSAFAWMRWSASG
jgi:hypothetical protein